MNTVRLARLGWTKREIGEVKRILSRTNKQWFLLAAEHSMFWMTVLTLSLGSAMFVAGTLPFFVLAKRAYLLPFTFLLGACTGLLYVHVLHDLKMEPAIRHTGTVALVCVSFLVLMLVLQRLVGLFTGENTTSLNSILSGTFTAGILVPYIIHWRVLHESS